MEELFEKAPVKKVYYQLALPVVFSMIISMLYNIADTYFVAKTGNTDLVAGITVSSPLFMFMLAIGDIFGLGGSALISRLFGQKRYEESKHVSSFSFYGDIIFTIILTVLLLVFEAPIMHLLGANAQTYQYAAEFYRVLVIGSVFITLSLVPGNMIRTEGLAVKSMIATISGTVLAIILDPIFLFGFKWGAAGVASANVLGYALNTGLLIYFTWKDSKFLSFNPKYIKVSWHHFKEIIAIGIPSSVTNFMQTFGMALLNNYLVIYGNDKVAAMGITQKVYGIVTLVLVGFAFGAQPLIGYNYGAKNAKRFREVLRYDFKVEVVYAIIASLILIVLSPFVIKLFMNNPQIIADGSYMLRVCLLTTPFIGAILVYTTVFQSAGKGWSALVMSISRQGVVYFISMVVMVKILGYHGVVMAQPVADILTCAIGYLIYQRDFRKFK
ncbi:MATE family efflux transporter [Ligilactobacillus salivarius]|uniref:MATE family efflux transporter n=1 Tax=Ligilactobacillus salivarius TaxID=1624 RepID=UPI00136B5292|nr:MATE family efflux transporter [Ligilactobacillus salivarius]MYV02323.1 MATE family efflux transporter [Ligilactobacillus salivarius]